MAFPARLATLVPVRNMSRAIKFYTKALGGKLNHRGMGDMKDRWASLSLGKDEVWLVSPDRWEKRTLAYTTLVVKRIKPFVQRLQKKGVKFERATRTGPDSRVEGSITYESFGAAAFFKDTEGNLFMIWQNAPGM